MLGRTFEVVVEVREDCPACFADADALDSYLTNLIASARDAMPTGGVIGLPARHGVLKDGSDAVEFVVRDGRHLTGFAHRLLLLAGARRY
jgi:signal transduction histidine kinase